MDANKTQVGGTHYKVPGLPEHWDLAIMYNWDPFQYQITKYIMRWKDKNGLEDLQKAAHFLQKYIENWPQYQRPPKVADFYQYVKPTGWVGFEFEGSDADGFHFRCGNCRKEVRGLSQYQPPWSAHDATKCLRDSSRLQVGQPQSDG